MKIFYSIIFFIFLSINHAYSLNEIIIKFKIENEIITNKDIENEKKYLVSLNNDLLNISKTDLKKIAEESIIREKIKKIEILKYVKLDNDNELVDEVIKEYYLNIGLQSYKEFEKYLNQFDLELDLIKEKVNIETNWNQLIYQKFNKQLSIDIDQIKSKLKNDISKQKYTNLEYDLSEIVFEIKPNETFEYKHKKILKSINEQGFKNASNLYSISDNAKIGGKIGWVRETQLSKEILNKIKKVNVGEVTKPVQMSNGFILIKINNIRKKNIKINYDEELNKLINIEKNKQYNQFSSIYFNKIKQSILISEI
tara:strand:+ start:87 stop:1019 length:933 start_codon:yes stop_codon:yes gene_type:complete